jgi:hypothetical protein
MRSPPADRLRDHGDRRTSRRRALDRSDILADRENRCLRTLARMGRRRRSTRRSRGRDRAFGCVRHPGSPRMDCRGQRCDVARDGDDQHVLDLTPNSIVSAREGRYRRDVGSLAWATAQLPATPDLPLPALRAEHAGGQVPCRSVRRTA